MTRIEGLASVHISLLAPNISRYMPGIRRGAKKPEKKLTILSRSPDEVASIVMLLCNGPQILYPGMVLI